MEFQILESSSALKSHFFFFYNGPWCNLSGFEHVQVSFKSLKIKRHCFFLCGRPSRGDLSSTFVLAIHREIFSCFDCGKHDGEADGGVDFDSR